MGMIKIDDMNSAVVLHAHKLLYSYGKPVSAWVTTDEFFVIMLAVGGTSPRKPRLDKVITVLHGDTAPSTVSNTTLCQPDGVSAFVIKEIMKMSEQYSYTDVLWRHIARMKEMMSVNIVNLKHWETYPGVNLAGFAAYKKANKPGDAHGFYAARRHE